jgi:hypothetical protein
VALDLLDLLEEASTWLIHLEAFIRSRCLSLRCGAAARGSDRTRSPKHCENEDGLERET